MQFIFTFHSYVQSPCSSFSDSKSCKIVCADTYSTNSFTLTVVCFIFWL